MNCSRAIVKGDFVDTGLWCLARLGARKLFYGPINQVLPASTVSRWVEPLLKIPKAEDAVGGAGASTRGIRRAILPAATLDECGGRFQDLDLEAEAERRSGGDGQDFRRGAAVGSCIS